MLHRTKFGTFIEIDDKHKDTEAFTKFADLCEAYTTACCTRADQLRAEGSMYIYKHTELLLTDEEIDEYPFFHSRTYCGYQLEWVKGQGFLCFDENGEWRGIPMSILLS